MSKDGFIILSGKKFDFSNESGQQIAGVSIWYLDPLQVNGSINEKGLQPMKVSVLKPELFQKLTKVPGKYDLQFSQRPGSDGKPKLVLSNIEYLEEVKI